MKKALYIQLYESFKQAIDQSKLEKSARLPSIRYLAERLNVSKTTVQMAYQQLLAEGYIESKARSGFFVADLDQESAEPASASDPSVFFEKKRAEKQAPVRYDFFMSDIDTEHFPLNEWRKCEQQALSAAHREVLKYGAPQGEERLRSAIADYLHRSRGVRCRPEQVVIAAGTQTILSILYPLINWRYNRLAMEEPGYQGVHRSLQNEKIQLTPIPVEEDGISLHALNQVQADAVYITPSHQYPLGMVMPIARRMQLLTWANKNKCWIIEDDYDGEFRYHGKPIPSLQSIDENRRVIYIGTFSKSLIPAIRVGYMILPLSLLERYHQFEWRQTASRLHQETLACFMESGKWEKHLRKMRTLYRKKQAALLETIKATMNGHVQISGQDAGLHIVLEVKTLRPRSLLISDAIKSGIRVYELSACQSTKYPMVLIGFGGLSIDEIREGIKLLHQTWMPYYL
nr:PLP-dependent aminotransferase family protein [Sporolactobacillus mangiferae]